MYSIKRVNGRKQPSLHSHPLSARSRMEKRYGLVYVDRDNFDKRTLKRYKKDSYHFYNKVIDTNGRIVFEDGQSTQI